MYYLYNSYYINKSIVKLNIFTFIYINCKSFYLNLLNSYKRTIGDGFLYLRGLFIICFIDACLTDDEPI